ncbi:hypothetical protein J2X46_001322 [Nocardioides sp. BE266]|uniref:DUF6069 family protein n=1 Tax=Nocardioides sp. BE266 TaxID=2817725 RepID=UPI0028582FE8|nr:DUF6069 family protein [Nocardioides sp. BE266]MDR7252346.1 hypothetical protein [Nocardioides sp. BE266]
MSDTVLETRNAAGRRLGRLVGTGLLATVVAMAATATGAALFRAAGVRFEVPDGGETIPVSGVAFVTGVFSVVGIVLAVALLCWSPRPATAFVRTAVVLTAVSLAPPFVVGATTGTSLALVVLHLVAATVMVPTLARGLRAGSASSYDSRA